MRLHTLRLTGESRFEVGPSANTVEREQFNVRLTSAKNGKLIWRKNYTGGIMVLERLVDHSDIITNVVILIYLLVIVPIWFFRRKR